MIYKTNVLSYLTDDLPERHGHGLGCFFLPVCLSLCLFVCLSVSVSVVILFFSLMFKLAIYVTYKAPALSVVVTFTT